MLTALHGRTDARAALSRKNARARARDEIDGDVLQGVRERLELLATFRTPDSTRWGRRAKTIAKGLARIERDSPGAVSGLESRDRKVLYRFRDAVLDHLERDDAFAEPAAEHDTLHLIRALVKLVRSAPWLVACRGPSDASDRSTARPDR